MFRYQDPADFIDLSGMGDPSEDASWVEPTVTAIDPALTATPDLPPHTTSIYYRPGVKQPTQPQHVWQPAYDPLRLVQQLPTYKIPTRPLPLRLDVKIPVSVASPVVSLEEAIATRPRPLVPTAQVQLDLSRVVAGQAKVDAARDRLTALYQKQKALQEAERAYEVANIGEEEYETEENFSRELDKVAKEIHKGNEQLNTTLFKSGEINKAVETRSLEDSFRNMGPGYIPTVAKPTFAPFRGVDVGEVVREANETGKKQLNSFDFNVADFDVPGFSSGVNEPEVQHVIDKYAAQGMDVERFEREGSEAGIESKGGFYTQEQMAVIKARNIARRELSSAISAADYRISKEEQGQPVTTFDLKGKPRVRAAINKLASIPISYIFGAIAKVIPGGAKNFNRASFKQLEDMRPVLSETEYKRRFDKLTRAEKRIQDMADRIGVGIPSIPSAKEEITYLDVKDFKFVRGEGVVSGDVSLPHGIPGIGVEPTVIKVIKEKAFSPEEFAKSQDAKAAKADKFFITTQGTLPRSFNIFGQHIPAGTKWTLTVKGGRATVTMADKSFGSYSFSGDIVALSKWELGQLGKIGVVSGAKAAWAKLFGNPAPAPALPPELLISLAQKLTNVSATGSGSWGSGAITDVNITPSGLTVGGGTYTPTGEPQVGISKIDLSFINGLNRVLTTGFATGFTKIPKGSLDIDTAESSVDIDFGPEKIEITPEAGLLREPVLAREIRNGADFAKVYIVDPNFINSLLRPDGTFRQFSDDELKKIRALKGKFFNHVKAVVTGRKRPGSRPTGTPFKGVVRKNIFIPISTVPPVQVPRTNRNLSLQEAKDLIIKEALPAVIKDIAASIKMGPLISYYEKSEGRVYGADRWEDPQPWAEEVLLGTYQIQEVWNNGINQVIGSGLNAVDQLISGQTIVIPTQDIMTAIGPQALEGMPWL